MGRKRKPDSLKIVQGTFRADRKTNNISPDLADRTIKPPEWLSVHAKRYWRKMYPKLVELNLISEIDLQTFEMVCLNYGIIQELGAVLKTGVKKHIKGKNSQTNLVLQTLNKAQANYKAFMGLFGLSPADRAGLKMPELEKEESEFDDFINRNGKWAGIKRKI